MRNLLKPMLTCFMCGVVFFSMNAQIQQMDFEAFNILLSANDDDRKDKGGGSTPSNPGGPGGGDSGVTLTLHMADSGVILNKAQEVTWGKKEGANVYTVIVGEKLLLNSNTLFETKVNDNTLVVPFDKIAFEKDKEYFLQVKSGDDKSKKSVFTVSNYKFKKKVLEDLKSADEFKSASDFNKLLMKAKALENNGLHMEAAKCFTKYMADDKSDMILRNMRDRFEENVGI